MDVREKLVELLRNAKAAMKSENLSCDIARNMFVVDFMMANGVTVQELDGCKYCKEYEDLPEHFIDGKPVGRVFDTCIQRNENGLWHLEVPCGADIGIRFCPMCGRELPQLPKGDNDAESVD